MGLVNGFPGHSARGTFADLRRDLEGAVVRSAAGVMRAGVFPGSATQLVTGRADMNVDVADFRAVQNRGGAIFLANDGVAQVALDAAPASNKRIDLIYVFQQSTTLGDTADVPVFGVVKGTASPTPSVPALPPAVSTAIPLATVEIPAGATTTSSAGVVITQVFPWTAMAGGTVHVRNSVELAAWAPADGSAAFNIQTGRMYSRIGGAWAESGFKSPISLTKGVAAPGHSGPSVSVSAGVATIVGRINNGNGLTLSSTFQQVATLPAGTWPDGNIIAPATNASTSSGLVLVSSAGALSLAGAGNAAITFAFSYPVAS